MGEPLATCIPDQRKAAALAVAQIWEAAGWPRPPREHAHHRLRKKLLEYVKLFDQAAFSDEDQHDIVDEALTSFMAELHLKQTVVDPMSLVRAVDDRAIERWTVRRLVMNGDNPPDRDAPAETDEELVARVIGVGATPATVTSGLADLATEGNVLEFQIVHRFLNLAHVPDEQDRMQQVASILRATPGNEELSDHNVNTAIKEFRERIARMSGGMP